MPSDPPQPEQPPQDGSGVWTVVATALDGSEAQLICDRLIEAGIPAEEQRSIGGPGWGESGARYVRVAPENAARARELLGDAEDISEDELARLSEEAGPPPPD
jgi:hypothetical protein